MAFGSQGVCSLLFRCAYIGEYNSCTLYCKCLCTRYTKVRRAGQIVLIGFSFNVLVRLCCACSSLLLSRSVEEARPHLSVLASAPACPCSRLYDPSCSAAPMADGEVGAAVVGVTVTCEERCECCGCCAASVAAATFSAACLRAVHAALLCFMSSR